MCLDSDVRRVKLELPRLWKLKETLSIHRKRQYAKHEQKPEGFHGIHEKVFGWSLGKCGTKIGNRKAKIKPIAGPKR
jgi:hypothetical protein